jgi:Haemolysin-III related
MRLATEPPVAVERPLLRGTLHGVAFGAALAAGVLLVVFSRESRVLPATVFAASAALMLGTRTLYHRITWSPSARLWMRRADHAGIFLLIAGTYTPVALISLSGAWRTTVLAVVWSGSAAAAISKFCWVAAPKWLTAPPRPSARLGRRHRPTTIRAPRRNLPSHPPRRRWTRLHRGCCCLRDEETRPVAASLRLPRGLPRAHDRCARLPIRCRRVLRPPGCVEIRKHGEQARALWGAQTRSRDTRSLDFQPNRVYAPHTLSRCSPWQPPLRARSRRRTDGVRGTTGVPTPSTIRDFYPEPVLLRGPVPSQNFLQISRFMAPGGIEPPHAASKAAALSAELRGRRREGISLASSLRCARSVAVAQLVELRVVVPVVAGSSPVRHPLR